MHLFLLKKLLYQIGHERMSMLLHFAETVICQKLPSRLLWTSLSGSAADQHMSPKNASKHIRTEPLLQLQLQARALTERGCPPGVTRWSQPDGSL